MMGILAPQGMKQVVMMDHTAVTLVLDGTGSHNTGNAAAGTNQHGDEALAGQAEAAEDTVHDERNTGPM